MGTKEYELFNDAMRVILKADPKVVAAQMEQDKRNRAEQRKAKREKMEGGK